MKTRIYKIQRIINSLQEIVDAAEARGIDTVRTSCNTYGLNEFVSLGNDGYLDLDADFDELLEDEE